MGDGDLKYGAPDITLGMVDVRDVGKAHLNAALNTKLSGRYILNSDSASESWAWTFPLFYMFIVPKLLSVQTAHGSLLYLGSMVVRVLVTRTWCPRQHVSCRDINCRPFGCRQLHNVCAEGLASSRYVLPALTLLFVSDQPDMLDDAVSAEPAMSVPRDGAMLAIKG